MFLNDLINQLESKLALAFANRTNGTVNGPVIDCSGHGGAPNLTLTAISGTITDGTYDVKVQEGSKSDGSDMADIAGATVPQFTATQDDNVKQISFKRSKQYVRAVITVAGSTSGGTVGALLQFQKQTVGAAV
jgi:hypothetical protein